MYARHLVRQGPVIGALVRTAVQAATQSRSVGAGVPARPTPWPEITATVPPRPRALIDDFVRWSGGSPGSYRGAVPPHLFPQWGFPLLARTLTGIPYDMVKVINAGCRLEVNAPLPDREPLQLRAWLASIDDDGRRAILEQRLVTGTASAPDAVVATLYAHVPVRSADPVAPGVAVAASASVAAGAPVAAGVSPAEKKKRDKPRVADGMREIARRKVHPNAGLQFALLTGDFNPVHWIAPYARAAGFRGTILHGFGTLAIAIEALNKAVFAGDPSRLRSIEVRFTRPLVLPSHVGVFVDDAGALAVGDAPGGPAYLTGAYTHA